MHWNIHIYFSKTGKKNQLCTQPWKTTFFMFSGKAWEYNFTFTLQTHRYTLYPVRRNLIANINAIAHLNILKKKRQTQTSYCHICVKNCSRNSCSNCIGCRQENNVIRHCHQSLLASSAGMLLKTQLNQNCILSLWENVRTFFPREKRNMHTVLLNN